MILKFVGRMSGFKLPARLHIQKAFVTKGVVGMYWVSNDNINGLFDEYCDMVYRIVLNIVRNNEEAQDVVMDTFVALMKQTSFMDENHIKAWLIRTAENRAFDVMRSARIKRNVPLDEVIENELHSSFSVEEKELLDIVMRLPEKLRSTVYMHYYEDMSAAEIAESLGISESTVYKRLERGRKALRKVLGEVSK